MGFFNKILKGLGFEEEEQTEKQKPVKIKNRDKKSKSKPEFASFDLSKVDTPSTKKQVEKVEMEEVKEQNETVMASSLGILKVSSQVEVQNVVQKLKYGEGVIINMSNLSQEDFSRSLDFLSGAVFALDKKMQKVDEKIFIIQ